MEKKSFSVVAMLLLLVLLILAPSHNKGSGGVMMAEARVCASKSQRFKGPCLGNHNCAQVCKLEGYSGGDCKGLRRRCYCTRKC